jgi:hypothetical protein
MRVVSGALSRISVAGAILIYPQEHDVEVASTRNSP